MPPQIIIILGKGGVGKSTTASLAALACANTGSTVRLTSMDPAHNLSDIFEMPGSESPVMITSRLSIHEINLKQWIKTYLQEKQEAVSKSYNYLSSFILEDYFKIFSYSPGMEELALLRAFESTYADNSDKDWLIFDMPPTALSLRFLSLPFISMIWTEKLIELREKILEKKEIVSKIKKRHTVRETDRILKTLLTHKNNYQTIMDLFKRTTQTAIWLVSLPEKLAHAESCRIKDQLDELQIPLTRVIINKSQHHDHDQLPDSLKGFPTGWLPLADFPLLGMESLQKFLQTMDDDNLFFT